MPPFPMEPTAATAALTPATILTCSYGPDLPLFGLLCESIDRHAEGVPHMVIVPRRDLKAFKRFAGPHREILAQEEFLPPGIWHVPMPPAPFRRLLRLPARDQYLTNTGNRVNGWILQQILKLQAAATLEADAFIHVDSDSAFIRDFQPEDYWQDGALRLFCEPCTLDAEAPWRRSAVEFLDLPEQAREQRLNFIAWPAFWRRSVASALLAYLNELHGAPWHETLIKRGALSEYNLYGLYWLFLSDQRDAHFLTDDNLALIKPFENNRPLIDSMESFSAALTQSHVLACVQSTVGHSVQERGPFLEALRLAASKGRQDPVTPAGTGEPPRSGPQ